MVLFEFDKIINSKYKKYSKNNQSINFEKFKKIGLIKISKIFDLYLTGIDKDYIKNILESNKVKLIFICLENNFKLSNIISIIIYHKTSTINIIKYYILAFGIHKKFRQYGYGKYSLDELTEF